MLNQFFDSGLYKCHFFHIYISSTSTKLHNYMFHLLNIAYDLDHMTIYVPCCDIRYDLRIEAMFGSSFPPVVYRRVPVLFTLFGFVCV